VKSTWVEPESADRYQCRVQSDWSGLESVLNLGAGPTLLVSDERVWSLHGERLLAALPLEPVLHLAPQGEAGKTLLTVGEIARAALSAGVERGGLMIAFGGGVVGDLCGFASSMVRRGIAVVQLPTTLLAQVDAAIGGKTGCNTEEGKNLLGAFHHPSLVFSDIELLRTLDARTWRAGLAELVKSAWLDGEEFLGLVERHADSLRGGASAIESELLIELIARAQRFKARIVSEDEREAGARIQLNLGHSFGHALEHGAAVGYLTHGEAVAYGMRWNAWLAESRGLADAGTEERLASLLDRLALPHRGIEASLTKTVALMRQDKKRKHGLHRLVLPVRPGVWRPLDLDDAALDAVLAEVAGAGLVDWLEVRA